MKNRIVVFMSIALTCPAFAQSAAKDSYVSAVIGGVSVVGLILIVGVYRLGKVWLSRAKLAYTEYRIQRRSPMAGVAVDASMSFSFVRPKNSIDDATDGLQRSPTARAVGLSKEIASFEPMAHGAKKSIEIGSEAIRCSKSPSDECWSEAFAEFEGSTRRLGLWAKVFAEAGGNEAVAKAEYLRLRAQELHVATLARVETERQEAEKQQAAAAFANVLEGRASNFEVIAACEAHLSALGFKVHRPKPDNWEISGDGSGTRYIYSAADLRKYTEAVTLFRARKALSGIN